MGRIYLFKLFMYSITYLALSFFFPGLKSIAGYHFSSLHCRMVLLLVLTYK